MKKLIQGLHLIEILVVLMIIGILAGISIPSYSQYIVYEKRLEAESILVKTATALERYHIEHDTYKGATLNNLFIATERTKKQYQISIQFKGDNEYLIIAKPIAQQANQDKACGSLFLDSLGKKNISGDGRINECW